ncbi:hypothetical protein [Paenibacillus sp. NPDC101420]|uniref:hypothetical protein n=1 Tax=Paenibacillus sp. NPDC101420 TaxID=3390602 RepID=UPI003D033032
MNTFAMYKSIKTSEGIKVFRYNTEFQAISGPGPAIGLIVMMNPGDARPDSNVIFNQLINGEYETGEPVLTKSDRTMNKVFKLIQRLYTSNNISLPDRYTIHIENLFNIREKNSKEAVNLSKRLTQTNEIMFQTRKINMQYQFVFLAWGSVKVNLDRQRFLKLNYPNAIIVNKINIKGNISNVSYPVHPLYMNTEYFLDASEGKLFIN